MTSDKGDQDSSLMSSMNGTTSPEAAVIIHELTESERQADMTFKRLCLTIDQMLYEAKQALDQSSKPAGVKVLSSFDMCKLTPRCSLAYCFLFCFFLFVCWSLLSCLHSRIRYAYLRHFFFLTEICIIDEKEAMEDAAHEDDLDAADQSIVIDEDEIDAIGGGSPRHAEEQESTRTAPATSTSNSFMTTALHTATTAA